MKEIGKGQHSNKPVIRVIHKRYRVDRTIDTALVSSLDCGLVCRAGFKVTREGTGLTEQ